MIDQQLIQQLDDPNPEVRADAVKQLARMKNQDAVQYLAAVYKTDNDPEIRELARKAGLYIKKKMNEEQWTGGDETAEDEPVNDEPQMVEVSERQIKSAQGMMDMAMNLHVSGDDDKALEYIEKAFTTNPNLQYDSYNLGLASTVMGVPGDQVAAILLDDYDLSDGKPKRKRKRKNKEDDVSTEKVLIDLLIYWLVLAAIFIVGMLIFFQVFSSAFDSALASSEVSAQLSADELEDAEEQIAFFMNAFMGAGLVVSIVYAVIASVFSVFGLLIQYAFIHFSATTILSGVGSFKGLIHRLTNFFTVTYAVYAIVAYVVFYTVFQAMLSSAMAGEDVSALESVSGMLVLIYGVSFIASFVWIYWLSKLIGKNYDFGTGKGCLTWIVANVLMSALSCACSFAFSTVIGNMLFSMMSSNSNF